MTDKKKASETRYLIQGFFFQERLWLGPEGSEGGFGEVVIFSKGLCRFMYAGVIYPDRGRPSALVGDMVDCFGESVLSDVSISSDEVCFIKKYVHRADLINYKFGRQGNLWVGGYSGTAVGGDVATCIITETPADLFRAPK
ncbi:MAG: hypothetical protein PHD72_02225 [Patescibacteria group bacterium]|nr:hypothetical protein [Patescibacteria group bacterium]